MLWCWEVNSGSGYVAAVVFGASAVTNSSRIIKLTHTSSSQILYIVQVYSWCGGDELLLINVIDIRWGKLSFTSLVYCWWTVYLIFYSWQLPISTQISSFLTILLILHVNCRLEWKQRRRDWFRRMKIGWRWKNLPNSSFLKQFVFVLLVRTQFEPAVVLLLTFVALL